MVVVLAFVAAFLSLGYVAYYLRGGPRIIDATSYFLEGRVLSHGHFSWTVPSPSESFRGRFLLFREPNRLAVIFPPGYPLLLAAGFRVGAPLVVGPLLAGALVVATYWLASELADGRQATGARYAISVLAAALSVVCVALRYHTADTMAHAASALGITLGLAAAFIGSRSRGRGPWLLAGLLGRLGRLYAPRLEPRDRCWSSWCIAWRSRSAKAVAVVLGIVPGALFLLVASHAQTGSWLVSAQAAYYADERRAARVLPLRLRQQGSGASRSTRTSSSRACPTGTGSSPRSLTTLRRLRVHLFDVANLEPLALLVLVPLSDVRWEATRELAGARTRPRGSSLCRSLRTFPSTSTAITPAGARASSPTFCPSSTHW